MSVPASVKQLLDKQNISYDIANAPATSETSSLWHDQHMRQTGAAKSLILQDDKGKVQVVIASDTLLDLSAVNRELNRELRATSSIDLKSFYEKHQLHSIPALPKLAGLTTIVDQGLLEPQALYLDSGQEGQLIMLHKEEFKAMVGDAIIANIGVPVASLKDDTVTPNEEQLQNCVKNFTNLRIKQRLEETLELPPLSETAQRIIKLRVDPEADISDLANIVETDPSLAAQVVSWAASPYYSAPGKIKSIHDAIVRVLGFDMVLNLALGLALGKTMRLPTDGAEGSQPYWQQAVYMAATVEGLVTAIPREQRPGFGMSYLSGLLSNFGYLVLAEVFPPHFTSICRFTEVNPHVEPQPIDRHILGITREQLSSWLMEIWQMPDEIVVALRNQGNPEFSGENSAYAKLLFVAQRLLCQRGVSNGPKLEVPAHVYEELHLDPIKAEAAMDNIIESANELNNIAKEMNGG